MRVEFFALGVKTLLTAKYDGQGFWIYPTLGPKKTFFSLKDILKRVSI